MKPRDPNPAARWHPGLVRRWVERYRNLGNTDGVRWAFMQVYDIPDVEHPDQTYLRRWRLIQTPFFSIYLHKIMLPDSDRDLHDHPWAFAALLLRGGYTEEYVELERSLADRGKVGVVPHRRVDGWECGRESPYRLGPATIFREHQAGQINVMRTTSAHRIRALWRVPTWTLCFVGPRLREWGFWTKDGWMAKRDYFNRVKFEDRDWVPLSGDNLGRH